VDEATDPASGHGGREDRQDEASDRHDGRLEGHSHHDSSSNLSESYQSAALAG